MPEEQKLQRDISDAPVVMVRLHEISMKRLLDEVYVLQKRVERLEAVIKAHASELKGQMHDIDALEAWNGPLLPLPRITRMINDPIRTQNE